MGSRIHTRFNIISNNEVEATIIFQGLNMMKEKHMNGMVVGDSSIIIKALVTRAIPMDNQLARLIQRSLDIDSEFRNNEFSKCFKRKTKRWTLKPILLSG